MVCIYPWGYILEGRSTERLRNDRKKGLVRWPKENDHGNRRTDHRKLRAGRDVQ